MNPRTAQKINCLQEQVKELAKKVSDLELKNFYQSKLLQIGTDRYGIDLASMEWVDAVSALVDEKDAKKHNHGLGRICAAAGYTKQGYYDALGRKKEREAQEKAVLSKVKKIRALQPMMGTEKLYHELHREEELIYHISRDRLYNLLFHNGMLISMKRNGRRTTNSYHRFGYSSNLIYGMDITHPNQVFVSDITYIHVKDGFLYLVLVTDLYSRRIVGYDLSNSLSLQGSLRALKRACRTLGDAKEIIHHSDRGVQFASHKFRGYLQRKGMLSSMTEEDHVYENSVAERVNGILKHELGLSFVFRNFEMAANVISKAIRIYNSHRPHRALDYAYPDEVYFGKVKLNKKFQIKKRASISG